MWPWRMLIIAPTLRVVAQFWTLCALFMALRVTQGLCDVS
ncbi:hypothetical protein ALQ15_113720 [Pseudomonas syringae pv. actinidiae]|uniref:Uncharacterized protein n=1 Tax=Pseudomonas syringae pv. actinidiae TaxID=103796 RepID=A0A7Z6U961_PSESF|nr:hypothetical protein ALQ15_113720 [Pseudomonas syringae pv. actinidiae]